MEGVETVLDYALVEKDHTDNISSLVIDDVGRYACGSDHALLVLSVEGGEHEKHY